MANSGQVVSKSSRKKSLFGNTYTYTFYDEDDNIVTDIDAIKDYIAEKYTSPVEKSVASSKSYFQENENKNGETIHINISDGDRKKTYVVGQSFWDDIDNKVEDINNSNNGQVMVDTTSNGTVDKGTATQTETVAAGAAGASDEENISTDVDNMLAERAKGEQRAREFAEAAKKAYEDSLKEEQVKSATTKTSPNHDGSAYWTAKKDADAAASRATMSAGAISSGDYRFFSIDRILSSSGAEYTGDDTLLRNYLYTKFIDDEPSPTNASIFGEFRNKEATQIATIRSLVDTIRTGLQKTNSNAFYKGTTATTNINYLNDLDEHINKFEASLAKLDEQTIANIVQQYRDALSNGKKEARRVFTRKVANEICSARQEWKRDVKVETYQSYSCKSGEEDGGPYEEGPEFSRERYRYYCIQEVTDEDGRIIHTIEKHTDALFYIWNSGADYPELEPILLAAEAHGCTVHKLPYVPAAVEDSAVRCIDVF